MKPTISGVMKKLKELKQLNDALECLNVSIEGLADSRLKRIQELESERDHVKKAIAQDGYLIHNKTQIISNQQIEIQLYREILELPRRPVNAWGN